MDLIKKGFGEQLKHIRKLKDFTQEKLAENIGINPRQLARIEAGESFVTSETIGRICTTLNIDPSDLFQFKLVEETLMTGTYNNVHFSVIREGNVIQLVNKMEVFKSLSDEYGNIDTNMMKLAQRVGRDITVDEILDGVIIGTKIYKPNDQIEVTNRNNNSVHRYIKEKIALIANDANKLKFVRVAINSIYDKEAREGLKLLLQ